eukprot:Colp12_sorted_trinity150504_noHs@18047
METRCVSSLKTFLFGWEIFLRDTRSREDLALESINARPVGKLFCEALLSFLALGSLSLLKSLGINIGTTLENVVINKLLCLGAKLDALLNSQRCHFLFKLLLCSGNGRGNISTLEDVVGNKFLLIGSVGNLGVEGVLKLLLLELFLSLLESGSNSAGTLQDVVSDKIRFLRSVRKLVVQGILNLALLELILSLLKGGSDISTVEDVAIDKFLLFRTVPVVKLKSDGSELSLVRVVLIGLSLLEDLRDVAGMRTVENVVHQQILSPLLGKGILSCLESRSNSGALQDTMLEQSLSIRAKAESLLKNGSGSGDVSHFELNLGIVDGTFVSELLFSSHPHVLCVDT